MPGASGSGGARRRWTRPHAQRHLVQVMLDDRPAISGIVDLGARRPPPGPRRRPGPRRTRTPRAGNAAPSGPGSSLQARCEPGAPGCLPGLRPPAAARLAAPAASSPAGHRCSGGIRRVGPEFREISRSSRRDLLRLLRQPSLQFRVLRSQLARSAPAAARSPACRAAATSGASGVSGTAVLQARDHVLGEQLFQQALPPAPPATPSRTPARRDPKHRQPTGNPLNSHPQATESYAWAPGA